MNRDTGEEVYRKAERCWLLVLAGQAVMSD